MTEALLSFGDTRRMTFEQFWELPDDLRAEYSDGEAIVNPPASIRHQQICHKLANVITEQLGDAAVVVIAGGWQLIAKRRLRIPDVMVLAAQPAGLVATEPPVVVVEVLSTNRSSDLVRKAKEYLDAGAGQYWIVDPRDREVAVFGAAEGRWEQLAKLTDRRPEATVDVAPFGTVRLAIGQILG
ncbi:MAG TPA: Uma2 family endonuclease [Actinomycetales bacterium]|nr:Uma2 family endonuclease [Actinomycetales bacterium]